MATIPTVMAGSRTIQAGRRIGKYEILQHLATGGMAEIYLARATGIERFEKLCVIKRILPAAAGNIELVKMLLDEARIAATLHHSNIVQVFDIGEADGEFFICMEYLHGRDVHALSRAARKRGTRLADDESLSIVLGVLAGLQYAHEKTDEQDRPLGIVHRDVSPTNVLVTYDGSVKLVDFGLVKAEGRITESRSGSLKGKLAYMSPEQCRARPCDRRSDLFSLSIMLWELTTGTRLFTGTCDYDYLTAILEGEPTRPSTVIADYPPALEAIVMKGLAKDPAQRYQTAEEMQIDLEEYCREVKLRVSPITLRRLMEDLFADELKSWQAARSAGLALEDHLAKSIATGSAIVGPLPRRSEEMAVPAVEESARPLRSRPMRRRRWIPLALAGALVVGAVGVTSYLLGRKTEAPTNANAPAAATNPSPTPTPPTTNATSPSPTPATTTGSASDVVATPRAGSASDTGATPPTGSANDAVATTPGSASEPAAATTSGPTKSHGAGKTVRPPRKPPPPASDHKPPHKSASDHDSLFPE